MAPSQRSQPEDELEDLPPIDGDVDDAPDSQAELDSLDLEGDDSLDDTTGEDDPADASGLEQNEGQGSWLDEDADTPDLDMGETGLTDFDDGRAEADDGSEPDLTGEEFGLLDATDRAVQDAGDEGPVDPDEELRDADLPALDADEEGDGEDARFWEGRLVVEEPLGLAWAPEPWVRVGAPLAVGQATALACAARGALLAGRSEAGPCELVRVDLEGSLEPLTAYGVNGSQVVVLAADGPQVAAIVHGGRLFWSDTGGVAFRAAAEGTAVADALVAAGVLWVQTLGGGLLVSTDAARSFARCAIGGMVCALARAGPSGVAALILDDARRPVALLRGGSDGTISREPVDAPEARAPGLLASRGRWIAYAGRGGVVRRGPDGWRSFAWDGRVTSLAFVDDAGTLVAPTYSDADDTTGLVRLDAAGRVSVVARVGASPGYPDSDGRVRALACDDSRGVVWMAGGFGVAAFAFSDR